MYDIVTKKTDDVVYAVLGAGADLSAWDAGTYNHYTNQSVIPPAGFGLPITDWTYTVGGGFAAV